MKSIIKFATAMLFTFFSVSAMAGEQNLYFADQAKCDAALADGTAMFYTPTLNRPAPKNWKRETLKASTCIQMETVQGMQFVALSVGSPMAQNPASKAWHHSVCTNWTNWLPGNNQSAPIASQLPGVIQAVGGGVVLKGMQCDAKCQQVKICGENGLTPLDKMNENGEWLCQAPDLKIVIIQNGSIRGEVHLEQEGWTVTGNGNLPAAPINFNTQRPNASVMGEKCAAEKCEARETFKKVSSVSADFCGIRTNTGDVIAFLDKGGKLQAVKNPVFDRSSGKAKVVRAEHDMVFNQVSTAQFNNNCRTLLDTVEVKGWNQIVKDLKLPATCTATNKVVPSNNKFGNV